jgi:hypothetical protein
MAYKAKKVLWRLMAVFLPTSVLIQAGEWPPPGMDGPSQRAYQVAVLSRMVEPVLTAGAENKLKARLPKTGTARDVFAPLEALGRTLAGIAPWLELGPGDDAEGRLRARYIELAVKSLRNSVDPQSDGFINFTGGGQNLVDAAFLAQGLMRAPGQLWGNLDAAARSHVIAALKATRKHKPNEHHWLLFSATIEAALLKFTGECEMSPIEKAVNRHLDWYKGDGVYGDGTNFHWDYYNSYVIQPMFWEVLEVCAQKNPSLGNHLPLIQKRAQRYAQVQERMISPEGTYPVIGRSSAYRFGAFQTLSLVALRHQLPSPLTAGGVRAGLNAVIHRVIESPGTFDPEGWLTIGVAGGQSRMAEPYINRGSLYLCTFGLLQLGLPPNDPFWTEPSQSWTQKKIWAGEDVPADHAIKE